MFVETFLAQQDVGSVQTLLDYLPPGASVTAVIVVVVLFLRHQKISDDRMETIQKSNNETQLEMQRQFRAALSEATGAFRDEIRELSKSIIQLRETLREAPK